MSSQGVYIDHKPVLSILLVGWQPVILQAMQNWLAPLGHQMTWVKNGLEAIREIRTKHFDMVVTQLDRHGLDCSVVTRYLKNIGDEATVIGLSPQWFVDIRKQPGQEPEEHHDHFASP